MAEFSNCRTQWGEPKRCRSVSISDSGWDLLGALAQQENTTRSEIMERMIRKEASNLPT